MINVQHRPRHDDPRPPGRPLRPGDQRRRRRRVAVAVAVTLLLLALAAWVLL
jgi:hypothetical protein